jgi:uncharacterized protein (TIGR00251 family)
LVRISFPFFRCSTIPLFLAAKEGWQMKEILLKIYLQPKASKNEIVGPYRDGIKVRVTAAPVEGRANEVLLRFLAKESGVSPSSFKIVRGHRSREKLIRIVASPDQEQKRRLCIPDSNS